MKALFLILPLAACVPHVDPCLRPCNPIVEYCPCVEMDRSDRAVDHGLPPDHGGDGGHHNGGSSDDNGDVSGSSDSNGGSSDD